MSECPTCRGSSDSGVFVPSDFCEKHRPHLVVKASLTGPCPKCVELCQLLSETLAVYASMRWHLQELIKVTAGGDSVFDRVKEALK